jgi:DNA helicase-2/ATP-dependent DNA helicase PcrA
MSAIELLSLTEEQQKAVEVGPGAYLLVAPPGSGKTEVLVRRVIRLLDDSAGQTFRVLALTFTTKAAEGLRSRAMSALGDEGWRLWTGTFHAFALDVLQHYGEPVGVSANVSVLAAPDERLDVLNRALESEGYLSVGQVLDAAVGRELLDVIDAQRMQLIAPTDASNELIGPPSIPLSRLHRSYEEMLVRLNAIDFPAMLERCHRLLVENSWTLNVVRRTYRYFLVDEAQDMSPPQFAILRLIANAPKGNAFLVADRNQAIYGFAGADSRLVDEYVAAFNAQQLSLSSNFRSATRIVAAANALAKHLANGANSAPMTSVAKAVGELSGLAARDEGAEAGLVADWVGRLVSGGLAPEWGHPGEDLRVVPEQICVLARTRFALEPIRARLETAAVPSVLRTSEGGLFDSDLAQATYFLMRVCLNGEDRPAVRKAAERLEGLFPGAITASSLGDLLTHLASVRNGRLQPLAEALQSIAAGSASVADLVAAEASLDAPFEDANLDAGWDADRVAFSRLWRSFEIRTREAERTTNQFMQWLSMSQRGALDEPGVRLLTVHAAKGLEFRAVALVGLNEGTFPYYKALSSHAAVNEERRSVYVAITRAARVLFVTRPMFRDTRYGPRAQEPSRFIEEMGLTMGTPG